MPFSLLQIYLARADKLYDETIFEGSDIIKVVWELDDNDMPESELEKDIHSRYEGLNKEFKRAISTVHFRRYMDLNPFGY